MPNGAPSPPPPAPSFPPTPTGAAAILRASWKAAGEGGAAAGRRGLPPQSPGSSGARRPASSLPQPPPQLTAAPPSGLRPALPEEPPLLLLAAAAACEAAPIHRRAACVAEWRFRPLPRGEEQRRRLRLSRGGVLAPSPLSFTGLYGERRWRRGGAKAAAAASSKAVAVVMMVAVVVMLAFLVFLLLAAAAATTTPGFSAPAVSVAPRPPGRKEGGSRSEKGEGGSRLGPLQALRMCGEGRGREAGHHLGEAKAPRLPACPATGKEPAACRTQLPAARAACFSQAVVPTAASRLPTVFQPSKLKGEKK